jgi:glyoxylase-like metal-dependent hydrolase (beta-lactamase superfamily II)
MLGGLAAGPGIAAAAAASRFVPLTPTVGYVPGDIERSLTCNTGVIRSADGISLVDAAIPEGAAAAYDAIRTHTSLPLARVVDTHYHLDHTYGNAFWSDRGAKPIAFAGMRAELAHAEPELYGGGPGLWQVMAGKLPQLKSSRPMAPSYVPSGATFGSGTGAFTIVHLGIAHTHSDAVVWVPSERVLFTGDLVANGPYNAVADSTIDSWIRVLDRLRALRPKYVVPGHGPAGGPELIDAQQRYFEAVTRAIDRAIASGRDVGDAVPSIRARLLADQATMRFVNDHHFPYSGFFAFHDLVAKIYHERTGKTLARLPGAPPAARCCGDVHRNRLATRGLRSTGAQPLS